MKKLQEALNHQHSIRYYMGTIVFHRLFRKAREPTYHQIKGTIELKLSFYGFALNWHRYAETTHPECLDFSLYSQLQATHEATTKELQAAQDSLYAKDGEVSTIRRNVEKVLILFRRSGHKIPLIEL